MKSKKLLKSALMATTFLCATAYGFADSAVIVTQQKDSSTTTIPVEKAVKTTSDTAEVKPVTTSETETTPALDSAPAVTASEAPATAVETAPAPQSEANTDAQKANTTEVKPLAAKTVVIKTEEPAKVVVKHHHQRGYLNGYKGYRHPRPHYARYVDGWYYPEAAFNTDGKVESGKVVSETVEPKAAVSSLPVAHIHYCRTHYRSYRLSDNSYQPYNGPRQQCFSRFYRGEK